MTTATDYHEAIKANCAAYFAGEITFQAFSDRQGEIYRAAERAGLREDLRDLMLETNR